MKNVFLFATTLLLSGLLAVGAETRGIRKVEIRAKSGKTVGLYEESHALVIGVSDYTAGWPKLPGVKLDVAEVASALQQSGFSVETVLDPDHGDLEKAFESFIERHGGRPENRLLFYFGDPPPIKIRTFCSLRIERSVIYHNY